MESLMRDKPGLFVDAVLAWTGYGHEMMPTRNDESVVSMFGHEAASLLLPEIKALMNDFYSTSAKNTETDLIKMGSEAASKFRRRHPDAPKAVVEALEWCFTFDYR
jgi:hypothetical protein